MQFFKEITHIKDKLFFLLLIAQEAFLIAHIVTGSQMLLRISEALKEFLRNNKVKY